MRDALSLVGLVAGGYNGNTFCVSDPAVEVALKLGTRLGGWGTLDKEVLLELEALPSFWEDKIPKTPTSPPSDIVYFDQWEGGARDYRGHPRPASTHQTPNAD